MAEFVAAQQKSAPSPSQTVSASSFGACKISADLAVGLQRQRPSCSWHTFRGRWQRRRQDRLGRAESRSLVVAHTDEGEADTFAFRYHWR